MGIASVRTPAPTETWQRLVHGDPTVVAYQSPDWYRAICTATGDTDVSRLYTMSDGREILLPLVKKRFTSGPMTVVGSPPKSWGMGGCISADPVTVADLSAIIDDVRSLDHLRVSIRPNPLHGETWAHAMPADVYASPRFAHVVDLQVGFDTLWRKGFAHAVRKGVKKSERNGVELRVESGLELLPVYYELFEGSIARWAEQQREPLALAEFRAKRRDPYDKLETIAAELGDKCRTWVAYHEGKPASALISIHDGRCISAVKLAMNKDIAGPLQTTDLIYSRLIEEACNSGNYDYFQLGESGTNPGLDRFKRRFGATGYDYAEYFIERLPLSQADARARDLVKRAIGFKDF